MRFFTFPRKIEDTVPRKHRGFEVAGLHSFMEKAQRIKDRALSGSVRANEQVEILQIHAHVAQTAKVLRLEGQQLHRSDTPRRLA